MKELKNRTCSGFQQVNPNQDSQASQNQGPSWPMAPPLSHLKDRCAAQEG